MEKSSLNTWEILFRRALEILDSAPPGIFRTENWTFGGGTVLMRRYRHRFSKDVDLFVPDPQYLGYLNPELNDTVDGMTSKYLRQDNFLKLYFDEGEIDFVVSLPLTRNPAAPEEVLGRRVMVESSLEILAKKIRYRAAEFTARDIFDFALVAEKENDRLPEIADLLREKREPILARIAKSDRILRTTFQALDRLEYKKDYDACVKIVTRVLQAA